MVENEPINSLTSSIAIGGKIPNYTYCTFFDSGYLSRGLALIESIRAQGDESEILVVCLDSVSQRYLDLRAKSLNLVVVPIERVTDKFPELLSSKNTRSLVEFYFTATPFILKYSQIGKTPDHTSIYLDADLYFFENPKKVLIELEGTSVALIRHDYPWFLKSLEKKYGTYNVGLLAFRNNVEGERVLDWWSKQCIEWCYDFPLDGKYADQGYLDGFRNLGAKISELDNPGFNLAPWNTAKRKPKSIGSKINVSNEKLTFFHFHGLKKSGKFWISSQLNYFSPLRRKTFISLYGTYVFHLKKIEETLKELPPRALLANRAGSGLRGYIANTARSIFKYLSVLFGQAIRDNR